MGSILFALFISLTSCTGAISTESNTVEKTEGGEIENEAISFSYDDIEASVAQEISTVKPKIDSDLVVEYRVVPPLPEGFVFNETNGEVTGTPVSEQETKVYTVTASNSGLTGTATLKITVGMESLPATFSYGKEVYMFKAGRAITAMKPLLSFGANQENEILPGFSDASLVSYAIAPIPPSGLIFDPRTGSISGSPEYVVPQTEFTVTARFMDQTSIAKFKISVLAQYNGNFSVVEQLTAAGDSLTDLNGPRSAFLSRDNKDLYVVSSSTNGGLSHFRRNTDTGRLTFVSTATNGSGGVSGLTHAWYCDISKDDNYIYCASITNDVVTIFSRNSADGVLTFHSSSGSYTNFIDPQYLTVSNDGSFLLVTGTMGNIYTFAIEGLSAPIAEVSNYSDGSNNFDLINGAKGIVNVNEDIVLIAGNLDNSLVSATMNAQGQLTFKDSLTEGVDGVAGLSAVHMVVVSPDHKHVYTAGYGTKELGIFSLSDSGDLSYIDKVVDGAGNYGIGNTAFGSMSPDGSLLAICGASDDELAVYRRDPVTGLLTLVQYEIDETNGITGINNCNATVFSRDGSFFYSVGASDHAVSLYKLD